MVYQSSNPDRNIQTRRVALHSTFAQMPKHFAGGGDIVQSHFIAGMSAFFPEGEDFFVRSVRRYRDEIADPTLKRQVSGFIGQEAIHGREHRDFNDRMDELGFPIVRRIDRVVSRVLRSGEKKMSPMQCLALTATIEHVTALLAETVLGEPEYAASFGWAEDLFLWHCLEESEHKAVAFDVYRAIGGDEQVRVRTMKQFRWGLLFFVHALLILSVITDRSAHRPVEIVRSWRRFGKSALMQGSSWKRLKDYERPDFHPDDWDASTLVEDWRERLFGTEGSLNDTLVGPAA